MLSMFKLNVMKPLIAIPKYNSEDCFKKLK